MNKYARILLLAASFLSGVAALNYELLWVRELTLIAGSTQAAISVVLSVYFLGLALGNYIAGRWAHRLVRPVAAYVGMELVIAVWALAFTFIMQAAGMFYAALYANLSAGSAWLHLLRTASAAMMLLVPTTCMGATLPLLVQFGAHDLGNTPRWSAWLYGLNTLGALTGVTLTGFVLVEFVGVSRSLIGTAALNLLCIACVLPWIRQRRIATLGPALEESAPAAPISRRGRLLLVTFGLLGLCNIAAEVLWTRFYALIYTNDTYMFSLVLMMYLLGVGAGSLLGGRLLQGTGGPVYAMGVLQVISAVWTIVMAYFVPGLVAQAQLISFTTDSFALTVVKYLVSVGVGVLIPTLCMGATFPLLVRAATSHHEQAGAVVGRALSWNTVGGVFGALLAGYVLLDRLGMDMGLLLVAGLTALIGLALCVASAGFAALVRGSVKWPVIGAVALIVAVPPRFTEALLSLHLIDVTEGRFLDMQPCVHGTTSVTEERGGYRRLWVNSNWIGAERVGMVSGYVPWMLHHRPIERALGLCMGSGGSFGALLHAAQCPMDVVEINREVVALSDQWMSRSNYGLVTSPLVRVVLDDARHFVRYGDSRYDLLTIEPMQPFQKGTAYFYTAEFYAEAKGRLEDGAVVCQFLPMALGIGVADLKSMVRTFVDAFPNAVLWGPGQYSVLIGYTGAAGTGDLNIETVLERMRQPALQDDFRFMGLIGPYDVFAFTLMDAEALRRFSSDGSIYTDDRPSLEFSAVRAKGTLGANLSALEPFLAPLDAMFQLTDRRLTRELTELRSLHIQLETRPSEREELKQRIVAIHQRMHRSSPR